MPLVPVQIGQDIMAIDDNGMEFMFLAPPSPRSFWIHHWYSIVLTKEKTGFKHAGKVKFGPPNSKENYSLQDKIF